jgi:hypothetical protein
MVGIDVKTTVALLFILAIVTLANFDFVDQTIIVEGLCSVMNPKPTICSVASVAYPSPIAAVVSAHVAH